MVFEASEVAEVNEVNEAAKVLRLIEIDKTHYYIVNNQQLRYLLFTVSSVCSLYRFKYLI